MLNLAQRGRKLGLRIHAESENDQANMDRIALYLLNLANGPTQLCELDTDELIVAIRSAAQVSPELCQDRDLLLANVIPRPDPSVISHAIASVRKKLLAVVERAKTRAEKRAT